MAFSAAVRRATSSAAPLAVRALRRGHHSAPLLRPIALRAASPGELAAAAAPRSFPAAAHFSSKAALATDDDLLRVIDDEIKCAVECDDHDRVEAIPDNFPFEIEDEKGMNVITLRRKYDGENIEVIVSMPSLVTGEEPEDDRGNDEEDDEQEKPSQSSIPLTVIVSKGDDSPTLEFSCTAYPDEVVIDSMSVRENKESDDMLAYEGPDFTDLDENLQKAFHKYLEIRGISPMTTNFLHEYMINKDSREYLLWLKNLKQFMQK